MRLIALLFLCFVSICALAFSQASLKLTALDEPPELSGQPKKYAPPSDAFKQLSRTFPEDQNNIEQVKIALEGVTTILRTHPDYSDAYLQRAQFTYCLLNSDDNEAVLKDIDAAIKTRSLQPFPSIYDSLADHYAFQALVKLRARHYDASMNLLEMAMKQDFDGAALIFKNSGTKPDDSPSARCDWRLSDLDLLIQQFPKDYRASLFRALYFKHFAPFDEQSSEEAFKDFEVCATLNAKSPLAHYYMGTLSAAVLSPKLARASGRERKEMQKNAVLHYTRAIQLDPGFVPAYEQRAQAYQVLQQYPQAIADYGKVLEREPKNMMAYADRGLAKAQMGQYRSAIFDYDEVIRSASPDYPYLGRCYQKRGAAHLMAGDNPEAIEDFTKAIASELASQGFLFSLGQFRALYSEEDKLSDEEFSMKLNVLFWPQFDYATFSKHLAETKGEWSISELNELYEQRGDAYLRAGEFRKGVNDFNRILRAIPIFATSLERWRLISASSGEGVYLDIKSVEFSRDKPSRLWLKRVEKNESHTVQSYDIDCSLRCLRATSRVQYSATDEILETSNVVGEWQRIIPETIGEQLYNGVCSSFH